MKVLLALTLSLFATVSIACTDFTGSYKDEESQTYTVSQSGCATVTVNDQEGTETIIVDGQYRVTEETDEVRITSAANFVGAGLVIDGKIEYKIPFPPEMPVDMIPVKSVAVYTLDSAGNLVVNVVVYNASNQVLGESTQTHQKI